VSEESFWRAFRRRLGWRDVLAYPVVFLVTVMITAWLLGPEASLLEFIVGSALISALVWPAALWVVDKLKA
jgi:hypothetical protein